jgi:hypothetical protein
MSKDKRTDLIWEIIGLLFYASVFSAMMALWFLK